MDIGECNLVLVKERGTRREFVGLEVAFAVGDGADNIFFQIFCLNRVLGNRFYCYPAAFKMAPLIKSQCCARVLLSSFIYQTCNQPQTHPHPNTSSRRADFQSYILFQTRDNHAASSIPARFGLRCTAKIPSCEYHPR